MRKKINIVMLVALTISASACQAPIQYAARRFYKEARGIKYDAFEAEPMDTDLSTYDRMEIEPLENQMEDQIPAELVVRLNEQLFEQVSQVKRLEVVRADHPDDERSEFILLSHDGQASGALHVGAAPLSFSPEAVAVPAPSERLGPRPITGAASAPRTVILRGTIVDFHPGYKALRVLQIGVGRQAVLTLHLRFVDSATGQELGKYVVNSEVYRMPSDSNAAVEKLSKGVGELVAKLVAKTSRPEPKVKREKTSPTTAHRSH